MTPALDLVADHIAGASLTAQNGWMMWMRGINGRDHFVKCSADDAVLVRQVECQLQRVSDDNRVALSLLSLSARRARVWEAWSRQRAEGSWEVDHLVGYQTDWSLELLERYERLLERIYQAHKASIDEALQRLDEGGPARPAKGR